MSAHTTQYQSTLVINRDEVMCAINEWLDQPLDASDGEPILEIMSSLRGSRPNRSRTSVLNLQHHDDSVVTAFTLQMQWESVCAAKPGVVTIAANSMMSMQILSITLRALPRRTEPLAKRQLDTPTMAAIHTAPAQLLNVDATTLQLPYVESVGHWDQHGDWQAPAADDRAVTWRWNVPAYMVTDALRLFFPL